MATHTSASVIPTSRTPLSVVLRVDNDGNPDDPILSIPRATLLAQLLEGPLKSRLAHAADWTVFNAPTGPVQLDDTIRFTLVEGGLAESRLPPNSVVHLLFAVDSLDLSIEEFSSDANHRCNILVEMRLVHANER